MTSIKIAKTVMLTFFATLSVPALLGDTALFFAVKSTGPYFSDLTLKTSNGQPFFLRRLH